MRLPWPFRNTAEENGRLTAELDRALAEIGSWENVALGEPANALSVHVIVGDGDWRAAAWMLASWCHFTEASWQIVIHDDGTLLAEAVERLRKLFPAARLVPRHEADTALQPLLRAFPFCDSLREQHPGALRVLDVPHFAPAGRFLIFDPSVLFLRHPREIVDWVSTPDGTSWLLADRQGRCAVSREEAREELGVRPWTHAGTGISLLERSALDLDFIDTVLGRTSLLRRDPVSVAPTLTILGASRGPGGTLPDNYEVAAARSASGEPAARDYHRAGWTRFVSDARQLVRPHLLAHSAS